MQFLNVCHFYQYKKGVMPHHQLCRSQFLLLRCSVSEAECHSHVVIYWWFGLVGLPVTITHKLSLNGIS